PKLNVWLVLFLFAGTTFVVVSCFCMVGSALGCQYFVRFSTRHSHLSARTLRLYYILANALVLELALSATTILVPGILAVASFFLGLDIANEILIVAACCIVWYPIATNVLIIVYVKPYRVGLLQMLRAHRTAGKRISVSSITLFRTRIK
ncbi:hypothetical protein AAVH_39072, partial [Aphelenchoides avenae]